MRALYFGGFELPDGNAAAQRVLGVGKLLRECGYEAKFYGIAHRAQVSTSGHIDGFEFINIPYPSSLIQTINFLIGNNGTIDEIKAYNPDIVILYNYPALAIEKITKYCHRNGIKVLADITEWYDPTGSMLYKIMKRADNSRRMKFSHKKLDGLICISDFLTDYYSDSLLPILNLPPLVDITQSKWHQKVERHDNCINMVYAGTGGLTKDRLDIIIQALDKIIPSIKSEFRFSIIGITKERYKEIWNDTKDHPYIDFLGRVPHEEVIKRLLETDFQIFLREDTLRNRAGFPTKFVETISSRTIPITNLSSNLSKYMIDGKNGWVIVSPDESSIQNALLHALNMSRSAIESMKSNIVADSFDYHNHIDHFKNFIQEVNGTK